MTTVLLIAGCCVAVALVLVIVGAFVVFTALTAAAGAEEIAEQDYAELYGDR